MREMGFTAVSRPLVAMAAVALVSGVVVLLRPPPGRADLEVWTFAETHARTFREAVDDQPALLTLWQERTGQSVRVELIGGRGLDVRLISLLNSGRTGRELPDLVEVEMGSVGKYFRSPVDQVGFLPLNQYLDRPGPDGTTMRQRLIPGRLAPWTKDGTVFGIPHDVHPVTITYRKDLWDEAGIDPSRCRTWEEFRRACIQFEQYWRDHGRPRRRAMELSTTAADALSMMLLQRKINLLEGEASAREGDAPAEPRPTPSPGTPGEGRGEGPAQPHRGSAGASPSQQMRVMLADPKVAATLAFYVRFVAGRQAAAVAATPGPGGSAADLAAGDVCAMLTPDWKAGAIREYAREHTPRLTAKLAMMPLPKFEPADHATSTWGGTMIAIPRRAADPERSWRLLEFLYFSPEALRARHRFSGIVPPLRRDDARGRLAIAPPVPFDGPAAEQLVTDLAQDVPAVHVTAYTTLAQIELARVLSKAVSHVNEHGDGDLERLCQKWLDESAADLAERIRFGAMP